MSDALIGPLSSVAAIIIFLALTYFYRKQFKRNMLKGGKGIVGLIIFIISIALAFYLIN